MASPEEAIMFRNARTIKTFSSALFGSLVLLVPQAHAARCAIAGPIEINQTNGFTVFCQLTRTGEDLGGFCNTGSTQGSVSGVLERSGRMNMKVRWGKGGSIGVYTAFANGDGELVDGRTFDQRTPSSSARWTSPRRLKCQA